MSVLRTQDDKQFVPDYAIPPGATLADLLEENEMTQTELSRRLGVSLKHVNQIVNGGASISADTALGLEKVLGVSAAFWIHRESLYRSDLARQDERRDLEGAVQWARRFPIAELRRRGFLDSNPAGAQLVLALLKFLGLASPKQWSDPTATFRKSPKFQSDPYALSAWLRVGELDAAKISCKPFNPDRLISSLELARSLTRQEPRAWHPQLVDACAEAGVAVVIVDTFSGARANGATRWLSPSKALIQLSLRYRWEDIFWFTLFHEAGHVLLHRKKEIFVEAQANQQTGTLSDEGIRFEREADRFATRTLVPSKYDRLLQQLTLDEVQGFADHLGIAPAIVIGRLQHEGVMPYSQGNKLRRRLVFGES